MALPELTVSIEVEYQVIDPEGADRQLKVYGQTGNFEAVVDALVAETREGCDC